MSKAYILLILGIWVAVLPFLGFPCAWKDLLTVLSGIGLILVSYIVYRESKAKEVVKKETFDNFSENEFEVRKEEEKNDVV